MQKEGRKEGKKEGKKEGWLNGWMDKQVEEQETATKTINNNNHISFICMTTCSYSIAIAWKTVVSQSYNLYNGMITMVNQVSSV